MAEEGKNFDGFSFGGWSLQYNFKLILIFTYHVKVWEKCEKNIKRAIKAINRVFSDNFLINTKDFGSKLLFNERESI
jgi:hypothetical protein